MSAQQIIDFDKVGLKSSQREHTGTEFKTGRRKPPQRVTVAPENKILVSREEASHVV